MSRFWWLAFWRVAVLATCRPTGRSTVSCRHEAESLLKPKSFWTHCTVALVVNTPWKGNSTPSKPCSLINVRRIFSALYRPQCLVLEAYKPTEVLISGASGLTEAALAKHNEAHKDAEDDAMLSSTPGIETGSVTANTFNTWATSYTDCTNATFSKVNRYWNSNSAQHKEVWQMYLLKHCCLRC